MSTQDMSQNTAIGGGGNLIPSTGNAILDSIFGAANVAVQTAGNIYGVYDTYAEKMAQREIARANATQAPMQSLPANQLFTPSDFLSDPERTKQLIGLGLGGTLLFAAVLFAYKKLK